MALFSSASRQIRLLIGADSDQLNRELGKAESRLKRFGRNVDTLQSGTSLSGRGGLGSTAALLRGGLVGGAALGAGLAAHEISKDIQLASDLNEQISASQVIFGDSADAIEEWSGTLAKSFGIAKIEGISAANTFGSLFKGTGQTQREAARLGQTVVELGGDLASFKDTSVQEALDALRSGLSGEIEPLRKYQVFLTEAAVAQEALRETGKSSAQQLTQGEKILARLHLILQQTSDAQGDAARTSGSLANQQKQLRAQVANARAELGEKFLPVQLKVVEGLNKGFDAAGDFASAIGGINAKLDDLDLGFLHHGLIDAFPTSPIEKFLEKFQPMPELFRKTEEEAAKLRDTLESLGAINLNPAGVFDIATGVAAAQAAAAAAADKGGKKKPGFGEPGFKPGTQGIPVTQVSNRLRSEELDARLSGNRLTLKGVLAKEAAFLQSALQDVRLTPAQEVSLKQALLGVTNEITSIDDAIIADANEKKQAAKDAKAKIADAHKKAIEALKAQARAFQNQADDIKSAVLNAFDSRQAKVENARALADAKAKLKTALRFGGTEGIKLARRDVQDAKFAVQRQRIEDTTFRVTQGPKGPVNALQVGTQNFYITTNDPEKAAREVVKILGKGARVGGQRTGRNPGTNPLGL